VSDDVTLSPKGRPEPARLPSKSTTAMSHILYAVDDSVTIIIASVVVCTRFDALIPPVFHPVKANTHQQRVKNYAYRNSFKFSQ